MRSTTRARLALCSAPLVDPVDRASKDELLFAEVPEGQGATLLAADPGRYREVVLREPFSRFARPVVVDVSRLPARFGRASDESRPPHDVAGLLSEVAALKLKVEAAERLTSRWATGGAVLRVSGALAPGLE